MVLLVLAVDGGHGWLDFVRQYCFWRRMGAERMFGGFCNFSVFTAGEWVVWSRLFRGIPSREYGDMKSGAGREEFIGMYPHANPQQKAMRMSG